MTGSPDAAPTPAKALGHNAPPKVGGRIEVTLTGTEKYCGDQHGRYVETDGGWLVKFPASDPGVSVEVLTPPAPTWWPPAPGDVARVWNSTYLRQDDNGEGPAWVNAAGAHLTDDGVLRLIRDTHPDVGFDPPALLIRSGKPVQP